MKIYTLIIFSLFSLNINSQYLEKNENLKKYKTIVIKYFPNSKKNKSKTINYLKNGLVVNAEFYNKNKITSKTEFIYDSLRNLKYSILKFDLNNTPKPDTILNYRYIYNDKNQLTKEILVNTNSQTNFSKFNSKNLPQLIERLSTFDSISGYKEERIYDSAGNIIQEKIFSKYDNIFHITTNDYKYDLFNNIIEINRIEEPKEKFPIPMTGGPFLYENEKFRYIYNSDGLWEKQYWIVKEKEILRVERILKKL